MGLVKTTDEIVKISKACRIAADVLEEIKAMIKPGITTAKIDEFAEKSIIKKGGIPAFKGYRGYKFTTCLSVNEEVVHGLPGDRKLVEGDIIGVDIGAIVSGYYGDTAETFPVGKISQVAKKLVDSTRSALYKGISEVRDGAYLGDLSAAIEGVAKANGFTVVKDLYGHGVGSALHEDPLIPNYGKRGTGMVLKEGMTIAIEPMLNIGTSDIKTLSDGWTIVTVDGKLSAHFEHTVLITKNAPVILTERDKY